MKTESYTYLKVIPTVKISPKRFSNPWFFFKENPVNYFHYVYSTLTLLHQHEDKNTLKTQHEKTTFILSFSFFDVTSTL